MPRKSYAKKSRKRNYRKRKRNYPSSKKINIPSGIPDRLITKLKYTQTGQLADGTGGIGAIKVFRGNSIYDPDYTGTGHQPYGRDQWANFYNYYKVHGCKIKVSLLPTSSTIANSNLIVALNPTISVPTTSLDAVEVGEQPYVRFNYVGPANGGVTRTLKSYMSTKKIFGQKSIVDDNFKSAMSTNPYNEYYYGLSAFPLDGSSTFTLDYVISITYYVEFQERVVLGPS